MSRASLIGAVIALAAVATIVFVGVVIEELTYVSHHPYA
jgi:hypothetical protein